MADTKTPLMATEKQENFISRLIREKLEGHEAAYAEDCVSEGLTRREASEWIEKLMAREAKNPPKVFLDSQEFPMLTHKYHYAVDLGEGLRFFKVEIGQSGKWEGTLFIKEQSGDSLENIKGEAARKVAEAISYDPREALITYGQHIGRCGHCNRTLTTEESRAAGIGPVCSKRL